MLHLSSQEVMIGSNQKKKIWLSEYKGLRTEKCALQGRREVNI
jgi:hypothetical protein